MMMDINFIDGLANYLEYIMNTKCRNCGCDSHCQELEGIYWPDHPCPRCESVKVSCDRCDCERCENHIV